MVTVCIATTAGQGIKTLSECYRLGGVMTQPSQQTDCARHECRDMYHLSYRLAGLQVCCDLPHSRATPQVQSHTYVGLDNSCTRHVCLQHLDNLQAGQQAQLCWQLPRYACVVAKVKLSQTVRQPAAQTTSILVVSTMRHAYYWPQDRGGSLILAL